MWINYLKVGLRTLNRNRFFSIINIIGLSIGIAAFVLIMMFVDNEYSFDKHFRDADQIYRVTLDMEWEQAQTQFAALAPGPTAFHLVKEYPEIISGCRFDILERRMLEALDKNYQGAGERFYEDNIFKVDSNFFNVFDLEIIDGDKTSMLTYENSIVISESLAEKYFGTKQVVGRILKIDNTRNLFIRGVMKDLPINTHFQTNVLLTSIGDANFGINNWRTFLYSFVKVSANADLSDIDEKLFDFKERNYTPWKETSSFRFQKMLDIHLKNDRIFDYAVIGDLRNVIFLTAVAFLVLIIACVNFMNLSTARSIYRSKEVGIRKVVGASRAKLIFQFIGESMIVAFLSTFVAIVLLESSIPTFQKLVGASISINYAESFPSFIALAIIIGFISGIYPAFFTSSFKPIMVLKGKLVMTGGSVSLRKILVIFQFIIMVVLMSGVFIIFQQMNYVKNKSLGFDKEGILYTEIKDVELGRKAEILQGKLLSLPQISSVFLSSQMPGITPFGDHFLIEGNEKSFPARTTSIGYNYIPNLEIELIKGRNFAKEFGTDSAACILNEEAVKKFGWSMEDAIGKKISWNFASSRENQIDGHVIGIVKDYHFKSLHEKIEPIILNFNSDFNNIVAVKISSGEIENILPFIEKAFHEVSPNYPFEYDFLEQDFEDLYQREMSFQKIFRYFVILAIIIASLGLIGITAFITEKKTKEIGIRKTFGGSSASIVKLFTKEFALWVLISNIIGIPFSVFIMNRWLNNFSYHIEISWWLFAIVFVLSLLIAILTVGFLAYKASLKNPVEAIRYE
jgi:putative ABC transport system permease protein